MTDATSGGVNPKGMRRSKSRVGLSKGLEVPTAAKAPKNTSKASRGRPGGGHRHASWWTRGR